MTQVPFLTVICILSLYQKLVFSQTNVASTINENENRFLRSGAVVLNVVAPSSTLNSIRTTVTYTSHLITSNYQLMSSITSISQGTDLANPTIGYNITIVSRNISQFQVSLYSVVLSRITSAKLTYFCVDRAIRDLQFYVLDTYFGDGKPGLLPALSTNSDSIFNFTQRISRQLTVRTNTYIVEPFIKGFKIINHNALAYSIELISTVLNSSHYRIDIKSSILSNQQVTDLYAEIVVYNETMLFGYHVTMLNRINVNFTQNLRNFNSFGAYHINEPNFYLGIKGFRFSLPTYSFYYDFFTDFPTDTVQLNGFYPPLQFIVTTIFSVELRQCADPAYPYFMNYTFKCYSSCPNDRRYIDQPRKQCAWCMHDCYTCVNGVNCSSCNITHHFREEDLKENGTLRCKPISGYYSTRSNDVSARKCDVTCVECLLQATNCTVCKSNQYLAKVSYDSTCNNCPINCATCIDDLVCTSCNRFYSLDSASQCAPVCTQNCSKCHIVTTPVETSMCDVCKFGFRHNFTQVSECHTICGDGIYVQGFEKCDDSNNNNGDGCDSECKTEVGYNCYSDANDPAAPQKCYYEQQVRFSLRGLTKYAKRNTFKFDLSLSTTNPSILKQLDWSKTISIDIEYFSFSIINKEQTFTDSYNLTIRALVLTFQVDYKPSIQSYVQILIDPKRNNQPLNVSQAMDTVDHQSRKSVSSVILNPNKFDTTPMTSQTLHLKSDNGIAIIYESDSIWKIALILEYCLYAIAGGSLLLLLFSLSIYGGKILAIEWLFVVNCAYFSLVEFQNLQVFSTIQALSGLKMISLNFFPIDYNENTKLWWAGISNSFIDNCLGLICIIFLGVIYFILMLVASNKISDPKSIKKFDQFKKFYSIEEVLMTLYMICAYGLTINFFRSISALINSTYTDISGIVLGLFLLAYGIIVFTLAIKRKNNLWQYKQNFYLNTIQQYYINFVILVAWANAIFLVALKDTAFGNIVPIVFSVGWIVFLVMLKPFKKDIERKRPIIVQVVNIIVQGIFMALKIQLTNNDQLSQTSAFFLYLPLILAVILTLGLAYTIYQFVVKMKNAIIDRKDFLENQMLFQKSILKCNHTDTTKQNSQKQAKQEKQEHTIEKQMHKQIMESFRKQKGFNFISPTLEYSKDELEQKWNKFENVSSTKTNSDIIKAKQINKQIKRSLFLQGTQIQPYFKFSYDPNTNETSERPDKKPKDWENGPYNNEKSNQKLDSQNDQQKDKVIIKTHQQVHQQVKYTYETQKYRQEWKQFFKPKTFTDEEKKHSLAMYDMI